MNFIRSGFKNIVGSDASQADGNDDVSETINRSVNRLLTATLPDDRRVALRTLKSLSKTYRLEVGELAMSALVRFLRTSLTQPTYNQEVDTLSLALETLKNIFAGVEDFDARVESSNEHHELNDHLDRLASFFLDETDSVAILLRLIDSSEFPVRLHSVRLLTALLTRKPKVVQEIVMENHASIPKIVDLLQDVQEVIRNDTVLLLCELTDSNASIQKIVAFQSGFERLFNIISEEANSVVAEDCLYLMFQLLNGNPSNVQLLLENSLVQYLGDLLAIFLQSDNEQSTTSTGQPRTSQMGANVIQLLSIIRCIVTPSNPSALVTSCQRGIRECGLLDKLCSFLLSSDASVDLLSSDIMCVAEVVRGNSANQDFLESYMTPSTPSKPVTLVLLLSMNTRDQQFAVKLAALYCIQCYLYKNERGKNGVVQTLSPSPKQVNTISAGQLICSGMVSADSSQVWLFSCVLCHCLYGASAEQERLLRVKLDMGVGQPSPTLIEQVTLRMLRSNDFQIQMASFMLLITWLAYCPPAVCEFLNIDKALPYLLGVVRSQEGGVPETLLRGMAAFLLGICALYNDDKTKRKCNRQVVLELVKGQLNGQRYVEALEAVVQSEQFANAARMPQPRASRSTELVFDHEFTKLFRALESSLCKCVAGNAALTNGLPSSQADMHDRIVDEYKQLIKQQDEENGLLRRRVEELQKCSTLQERVGELEQLLKRKVTEEQLNALGQLEQLRCNVTNLQAVLAQRDAEVKYYQQNCQAWEAYAHGQRGGSADVEIYQAQIQELTTQLDNGWQLYEQQSQRLAEALGENERLKAQLEEANCSLKLCQMHLTHVKPKEEEEEVVVQSSQEPCAVEDYAALSQQHEVLLELLNDQDLKIKELRQRLAQNNISISSDDGEEEEDDNGCATKLRENAVVGASGNQSVC